MKKPYGMKLLINGLLVLFFAPVIASQPPKGIMSVKPYTAQELKLSDIDGTAFDLKSNRGSWTFVHFWASWCGPCRKEMPTIQEMVNQTAQTNLKTILVNTAETEDEIFTFLAIAAPNLNSLMDLDGQVTRRWNPRGLPSSFLVDPAGKVRFIALGGRPWNKTEYIQFLKELSQHP